MQQLVKINPKEYGLTETKAKEIENAFKPMLEKMTDLENKFNEVISKEISKEICLQAKKIRLEYVKVRTGVALIHKEQKAFYLSGGRAVDGWKNTQLHASQGNEQKLMIIEKHYENIEKERILKIVENRTLSIQLFDKEAHIPSDLGEMSKESFEKYIEGLKLLKQQKEDSERKEKEERIAKEKAELEEKKRIEAENKKLKEEAEEREKIEAERIKKELIEKTERERVEKERLEKENAEKEKIKKEHEEKLEAIRNEKEKIEAESKRLAVEKNKKEEIERLEKNKKESREKDVAHRKAINNSILNAFNKEGLDEDISKTVLTKIALGEIPNIKIIY